MGRSLPSGIHLSCQIQQYRGDLVPSMTECYLEDQKESLSCQGSLLLQQNRLILTLLALKTYFCHLSYHVNPGIACPFLITSLWLSFIYSQPNATVQLLVDQIFNLNSQSRPELSKYFLPNAKQFSAITYLIKFGPTCSILPELSGWKDILSGSSEQHFISCMPFFA